MNGAKNNRKMIKFELSVAKFKDQKKHINIRSMR